MIPQMTPFADGMIGGSIECGSFGWIARWSTPSVDPAFLGVSENVASFGGIAKLSAGDQVYLELNQDNSGAANVIISTDPGAFWVYRLDGGGGGAAAGVSSFNSRTGSVTLTSADVSGAGGALDGAANTFTVAPQTVLVDNAAHVGTIVKAAASQTADLAEWQDSSAAVLASVSAAGAVYGQMLAIPAPGGYGPGLPPSGLGSYYRDVIVVSNSVPLMRFTDYNTTVAIPINGIFGFCSGSSLPSQPVDAAITRYAAGVVALPQLYLAEGSAPSTPTGGGILYCDGAGNLYYLSPGGTSTLIAPN